MEIAYAEKRTGEAYARVARPSITITELKTRIDCALATFVSSQLPNDTFTSGLKRVASQFEIAVDPKTEDISTSLKFARNELSRQFNAKPLACPNQQHVYDRFESVLQGTAYAIR